MLYISKEQAFLEPQKGGVFPEVVRRIEVDGELVGYTPNEAYAFEYALGKHTQPGQHVTITVYRR